MGLSMTQTFTMHIYRSCHFDIVIDLALKKSMSVSGGMVVYVSLLDHAKSCVYTR